MIKIMNERAQYKFITHPTQKAKSVFAAFKTHELSFPLATFPLRLYKMDEKIKNVSLFPVIMIASLYYVAP